MYARGNYDFTLGSLMFELSQVKKKQDKMPSWIEIVLNRVDMNHLIS